MKRQHQRGTNAFSLLDLALIIAALAGIILVILPVLTRPRGCRASAPRIACINNLKQVNIAFRIWAEDNNGKYPTQVSVTNGGAMELVATGHVAALFQSMSNELNTPKILFCPTDKKRVQSVMFSRGPNQSLNNSNVSYFAALDANPDTPSAFLSGDENFLIGGHTSDPLSGTLAQPGILSVKTNDLIAWSKSRHERKGNIGLADGSVQGFSTSALRTALHNTGLATNRLALP